MGEIGTIKTSRDCCIDQLPPESFSKTGATFRVESVGDRRLLLNSVNEPSSPLRCDLVGRVGAAAPGTVIATHRWGCASELSQRRGTLDIAEAHTVSVFGPEFHDFRPWKPDRCSR